MLLQWTTANIFSQVQKRQFNLAVWMKELWPGKCLVAQNIVSDDLGDLSINYGAHFL